MTEPKLVEFPNKLVEIQLFEGDNPLGILYCTLSDWDRLSIVLNNLSRFYKFNHNDGINKYKFKGLRTHN